MDYRIEHDSLGSKNVPKDAYYGIHTLRAKQTFEIVKDKLHKQMIRSLAIVKKSAAIANKNAELIDPVVADAICLAADEVLAGKFQNQFITTIIQGGAGVAINMNMNEVLANRANELLGGKLGAYDLCHPIDHVDFAQSSNDVIPTSIKIATIYLTRNLLVELTKLNKAYLDKANELKGIIKLGKTHLQNAAPISFSQEFTSMSVLLERDIDRIEDATNALRHINIGATLVGTGLNANEDYIKDVVYQITKSSRIQLTSAKSLIDSTRNFDSFAHLSSVLRTLAINLSKTCNDLRLMSSADAQEIILPEHISSTKIPLKINPVVPEAINQAAFQVMGHDLAVAKACEAGQLELNVFSPIIMLNLFDSLELLKNSVNVLRKKCIQGITVNKKHLDEKLHMPYALIASLTPHLGYDLSNELVRESFDTGKELEEIILSRGLLNKKIIKELLDTKKMINKGILREDLITSKHK